MTLYISNRDGNGKTSEEGHYRFQTSVWSGDILGIDSLKVSQNSPLGMSVLIDSGQFKIDTGEGYSYTGWNSSQLSLTISNAGLANPRITTIVTYVDRQEPTSSSPPNNPGIAKFAAIDGLSSAIPVPPPASTIRSQIGANNPYIILANITVPTGATQITNSNISDLREHISLATNTVGESALRASSVTTDKLADLAVIGSKLAASSITSEKIADAAVGDAKWRNGIAFHAERTSTLNAAASTWVKLACNSIVVNIGSGYSNTSNIGRFTAPVKGLYFFTCAINASATTQVRTITEIRKNGTTSFGGRTMDIAGPSGSHVRVANTAKLWLLEAGDYVEAYGWVNVAANIASGASTTSNTEFNGFLVTRL